MFKKYNIGAVLKNLIKERGYTQEEFAEEIGIGLSTLKKYITGQVCYSIETLELFADFFKCSYDYLLGKSLTPYREIQDVKQATRLTDGALDRLIGHGKNYDESIDSKRYLDTLSNLIQYDFLIDRIVDYFYIDSDEEFIFESDTYLPGNFISVGSQILHTPDIEDAYIFGIVRALINAKEHIGQDVPTTLRNLKTNHGNLYIDEED
ncbi:MAG: hypothetical protein RHS_0284 [Robinsoniella sp. RHS]|uniref:helix-turn-helix domain-containing protein n=1 Tax=Robinsoniella sp. RHS TaxID=1504536 RepID=UPI000658C7C2|nr:MAG: hypothetical protein RHS_0284 [Robinsoniella sp. RHS]